MPAISRLQVKQILKTNVTSVVLITFVLYTEIFLNNTNLSYIFFYFTESSQCQCCLRMLESKWLEIDAR